MPKRDQCHCGKTKDVRARQCRACFSAEPSEKTCSGCGRTFPIESFALRPDGRGGHKRRSRCRDCETTYAREHRREDPERHALAKRTWVERNPEKVSRATRRKGWRKLGLDPDEMERRFAEHDGSCEACGSFPTVLYTDHNHDTGEFRGWLCSGCNLGYGHLGDDPERVEALLRYALRTA